jgi:hypothetical protein
MRDTEQKTVWTCARCDRTRVRIGEMDPRKSGWALTSFTAGTMVRNGCSYHYQRHVTRATAWTPVTTARGFPQPGVDVPFIVSTAVWPIAILGSVSLGAGLAWPGYRLWRTPAASDLLPS